MSLLDDQNFLDFYVAAKKCCYSSRRNAIVLANGGRQYVFRDDHWPQWYYRDVCHGDNPFFGRAVVEEMQHECSDDPLWAPVAQMTYNGYASGTEEEVKRMFAFLKKSPQRISVQSPFQEPTKLNVVEDDLTYCSKWERKGVFLVMGQEFIQGTLNAYRYDLNFQFCVLR